MTPLLTLPPAAAHGGEDHGTPPATPVATATGLRVPLTSDGLDAVLVVPPSPSPDPRPARLLVADAATSAPVTLGSASLSLTGPAAATASFTGRDGVHEAPLTLPVAGDYAGSLVVDVGGKADLLAVTGIRLADVVVAPPAPSAGLALPVALAAGLLLLAVGFLLGRWRRAAAALLAVILTGTATRVAAHGGEDHGAPAPTAAPAGAGLTLPMESQFLVGLRTVRVYAAPFQVRTLGLGALTAAPGGAATLRASAAGTLTAPPGGFPAPGARVRAGQVLALLHETPSTADRAAIVGQHADAETRLAAARAALRLAQRDLERAATLGDAISERERVERQNAVDVATTSVREAERAAGTDGAVVPIVAPLTGRLALGTGRPGDQVGAGDELFHVLGDEALWVRARVPEGEAGAVRTGGAAEVTLPSAPGRTFPAVVVDGGVEADPRTGTVTVTLALDADPALRPGLAASAWIAVGAPEDAVAVPDDAVVESGGVRLVFVKTGPERFEAREVALGARGADTWEIHAGLRPAERVVVAGTYALKSLAGR